MSVVARKQIMPGNEADVDDGDASVTGGKFWPAIQLSDLRLAARITGSVTTSRLIHVTTEAVAHVTDQLQDWQIEQESSGYATLAEVPAQKINGESVKVYRFRRAVYSVTRALVLENYRDVDTTPKGEKAADALDAQCSDLWRDARWSIADIQRVPRIYAELC